MANTKSLVHLAGEVAGLSQALIDNGGVLTPELEALFDLTTGDLRNKVDRYKFMIDGLAERAEYFKKLEDEIKAARKTCENNVERLKDRLKYVMTESGEDELRGNNYRFKMSASKDKLVLDHESGRIPDEYFKEVTERVPDKDAIITAIKMGFEVPGVELVPGKSIRAYVNAEAKAREVTEVKGE